MSRERAQFHWFARKPRYLESDIGGLFLDFLFAIVLARILVEFSEVGNLPAVAASQLALAGILTLTSWLAYRGSRQVSRFALQYFNLPLLLFVIHLALVVLYFVLAAAVEAGPSGSPSPLPSATLESAIVAISFVLYWSWESVAATIRRRPKYRRALPLRVLREEVPEARRTVTLWFTMATVVIAALVAIVDPHGPVTVQLIDYGFVLLVVTYRWVKDGYG